MLKCKARFNLLRHKSTFVGSFQLPNTILQKKAHYSQNSPIASKKYFPHFIHALSHPVAIYPLNRFYCVKKVLIMVVFINFEKNTIASDFFFDAIAFIFNPYTQFEHEFTN